MTLWLSEGRGFLGLGPLMVALLPQGREDMTEQLSWGPDGFLHYSPGRSLQEPVRGMC